MSIMDEEIDILQHIFMMQEGAITKEAEYMK